MIRTLTEAEAYVIEAAVTLDDYRQEALHGYRKGIIDSTLDAKEALREAVENLHNENDGRWDAP